MCASRVLYATTCRYARETSGDVLRKGARDAWDAACGAFFGGPQVYEITTISRLLKIIGLFCRI